MEIVSGACLRICLQHAHINPGDTILTNGFVAVRKKVTHTSLTREFDSRVPVKNKFYLQCVLFASELFAAGAANFPSQRPQVFYKLLLRSPSKVRPNMRTDDIKRILDLEDGVEASPPMLPDVEVSPPMLPDVEVDLAPSPAAIGVFFLYGIIVVP